VAEKRPFRIVLGEGPQKGVLGGSLSRYVPPGAQYDYKPPSVFERYKALSIGFAVLLLAVVLYLISAHHFRRQPIPTPAEAALPATPAATTAPSAAAADPVYVLPISPPANR
jgi:hypothetical protein